MFTMVLDSLLHHTIHSPQSVSNYNKPECFKEIKSGDFEPMIITNLRNYQK